MATDAAETKHDMLLEVTEPKGPGKQEKNECFQRLLKETAIKSDAAITS